MAQHAAAHRIVPDPPSPAPTEHDRGWGFADSGFALDESGRVVFVGSRYAISGKVIPGLLPWAEGILGLPLDPRDANPKRDRPEVPERVAHPALERALAERLPAERRSTDPLVRLRHGHGHTQEDVWDTNWGRFERVPDLVVWPVDEDEVRFVVDCVRAHGGRLVPFGGGTNVCDALRCRPGDRRTIVSLDLRRMNRVRWLDPVDRTACIEAGATGLEIEEQLRPHGFTLGHEPDSAELSTLGGWIAMNASGMKKNRYGNIEDLVLAVSAVTADGALLERPASPRESVGGDPARWLIGSEGRLGVVTSAVVKVFPLPEQRRFGSILFRDFEAGVAFLRDVERSGHKPASVRLMDNLQFQFGQALKPAKGRLGRWKSALERAVVLHGRGFEAERMVACTLLFEGSADEVRAQQRTLHALARRHRGMRAGAENGERGYQLTFAIAYIRDFMLAHWVIAESFETSVPWSGLEAVCANVKQRVFAEHAKRGLPGRPFISVRVTQLYETGVCLYFYLAFHYKGVERPSAVFAELEQAARDEILAGGGSLSHHHGVGQLRAPFLPRIFSPAALDWRARQKRALDPDDLFGCGGA